jgi:putative transcriptional regulator
LFFILIQDLSSMDKEQLQQFGEGIRQLRRSKNLTQAELASRMGKDQQSIQRLESGKVNPTYLYLLELAKGLEMDISELVAVGK